MRPGIWAVKVYMFHGDYDYMCCPSSQAICVGPQLSRRKRSLLIEAAVGTVSSKSKVFYGLAAERGLRDDMEDYASVLQGNVDRGDFVYAGATCSR